MGGGRAGSIYIYTHIIYFLCMSYIHIHRYILVLADVHTCVATHMTACMYADMFTKSDRHMFVYMYTCITAAGGTYVATYIYQSVCL